MLSSNIKEYTQKCYLEAERGFGSLKSQIQENMSKIHGDERALMELCYGTLPSCDIGAIDFNTIRSYASHAMLLYNTYEEVSKLPEDVFLHYVFYPRINSEQLVDCRSFFYSKLKAIMDIPDKKERVLAVNRWCAAQVTYGASDNRTESPMAAYYSGSGRCGEESVFTVTALRSIGIPARQVYVPWWSHCDDNHAWVEIYVDGEWYFMGACEPEPMLNRGWFTAAASRAPLVHSRTFFDYGLKDEEFIGNQGMCLLYNQTSRYARVSTAVVEVKDNNGRVCEGARVSFQIINMAAAQEIAALKTGADGKALLRMGCGSVHIEVFYNGLYGQSNFMVKPDAYTQVSIGLTKERPCKGMEDMDFMAPLPEVRNAVIITNEQQSYNKRVIAEAKAMRQGRLSSYWRAEFDSYDEDIKHMLHLAGGNAGEIAAFYNEKSQELMPLAKELLKVLSEKDYKDVTANMLNKHFYGALGINAEHDELFISYVMCPRIGYENLDDWRENIDKAFTAEQKEGFYMNPPSLMKYINEHYREGEGRYYDVLTMTPADVINLGLSDEKGRSILFVAVMRTLGVPSRLNPCDGSAEYYRDGGFHRADSGCRMDSVIELVPEEGKSFTYLSDFSLSKWHGQGYRLLKCFVGNGDNSFTIPACEGHYRLITTNRLPSGNQLVRVTHFEVDKDTHIKKVTLTLRAAKIEDMLENNPIHPFEIKDDNGNIIIQDSRRIIAYLDPGTEPTEHVLNELMECLELLEREISRGLQVVLVLRNLHEKNNPTLMKAINMLPHIIIAYDDFEGTPSILARAMYLELGVWPLVLLLDSNGHGRYGSCGYSVGLVELIIKLSRQIV